MGRLGIDLVISIHASLTPLDFLHRRELDFASAQRNHPAGFATVLTSEAPKASMIDKRRCADATEKGAALQNKKTSVTRDL
jgi:hypothetical protein